MAVVVRQIAHEYRPRQGGDTLHQRFRFQGPGVSAAAIADVLATEPMVGERSIFGTRPGREVSGPGRTRGVRGFSPAPGFRFDVDVTEQDGSLVLRFSQPDRREPYLEGEALWTISDDADGAVLDEQINTERALEVVTQPLDGPRRSLRRWLFFRLGHRRVMAGAMDNIAALLDDRAP